MASSPAFIATGRVAAVNVATANTATDGTGTIASLIAGVAAGTRVNEIDVKCAATSAAAQINLFISSDTGSTWKIFDSVTVTAVTQSATVAGFRGSASYTNLILPSAAHIIGVTTTISQSTNVVALGGDL